MATHSKKEILIDLFNLPPLPDERNTLDAYMDVPHNFYIPDGKNTRLIDRVERREFERQIIDNNEGFVLQIPFLECAFGTLYYVIDKQNGNMMGIIDDQLQSIDCGAQMEPFDLAQLSWMITERLEQKRQGFNDSSVSADAAYNNIMWYPSTPQDFRSFDSLKELWHDGNILMSEERSGLYNDCTKVILDMAESYVFSRCIYFNLEMTEKYQNNTDRYIKYYTNIIRQIDIFLQEDQLMCTKEGFPLVPALSYLPNMYELGHNDVGLIDDRASTKVRRVENEIMVIMQEHQKKEQQNVSHNSFCSSFSRIRSEELNNMGYGLSRISPITFDDDAFQMPSNRAKDRALTLTPIRKRNEVNTGSIPTTQTPQQDGNARSYNADLSVAGTSLNEPSSRFVPPQPNNTGSSSQEMDNSNTTTVYYEKSNGEHQNKSTSIQRSPRNAVSAGTTTATQTTNQKALQVGGTQIMPPPSSRKSTSTGETQTSPPKDKPHRQIGQG